MIEQMNLGYVAPKTNRDTQWWWDALNEGRLTLPECGDCRSRFFPPQPFCPECGSGNWQKVEPEGGGKVYSWVVAHRVFSPEFANDIPFANVAVDLVDGGRLIGRWLDSPEMLEADLDVRVKLYRVEDTVLLGFVKA